VVSLGAAALLPKPLDLDLLGMMIGAVTSLRVEAPRREPETKVAVPRTLEKASARVLVVDDDEEVRSVLRDFLEHARYQAVQAPDGVTALRSIADEPPQIVLLDIQMPGLSGIEAAL
jgi:PleD family two-component response regulator